MDWWLECGSCHPRMLHIGKIQENGLPAKIHLPSFALVACAITIWSSKMRLGGLKVGRNNRSSVLKLLSTPSLTGFNKNNAGSSPKNPADLQASCGQNQHGRSIEASQSPSTKDHEHTNLKGSFCRARKGQSDWSPKV